MGSVASVTCRTSFNNLSYLYPSKRVLDTSEPVYRPKSRVSESDTPFAPHKAFIPSGEP